MDIGAFSGLALVFKPLAVAAFGLILGCFSTALIYRAPRGIPWGFVNVANSENIHAFRSACPSCKAVLAPRDLIPVLSWILTKGRCRRCGQEIGAVYPAVEIGVALACLGVYAALGLTLDAFFIMAAIPFLAALLVIDLRHLVLPDQLTGILAFLGVGRLLALVFYGQALTVRAASIEYLAGAALYGLFAWILGASMSRILKKDAMGFGDVKFFAVAGLWLGISGFAWFCIFSGISGLALGILWKTLKKGRVFPFGPALISSFYFLLIS